MKTLYLYSCWLCLTVCAGVAGCAKELPGEDVQKDSLFYFPTGISLAPGASQALVVSSNFDQRFNTGWVSVIDIAAALDAAATSQDGKVAVQAQPLKVPTLGGRLAVDASHRTALLAHRGAGLLTVMSLGAPNNLQLSCGTKGNAVNLSSAEARTDCDADHLVNISDTLTSQLQVDPTTYRDYQDPYAVALFADGQPSGNLLATVGYLGSQWVTIFKVDAAASPALTALRNMSIGPGALLSLVVHPTNNQGLFVTGTNHASSGNADRSMLYDIDVGSAVFNNQSLVYRRNIAADIGFNQATSWSELSAVAYAPDGNTAYATNHGINVQGDSVIVLKNQATAPQTWPAMTAVGALALDRSQPTDILYVQRGAGDLVVVASLLQDTLYFLVPQGDGLRLVHRLQGAQVGQGPFAMAHVNYQNKDWLLVTTFFDHGVSFFDISSTKVSQFQRKLQIRNPSFGVAARAVH